MKRILFVLMAVSMLFACQEAQDKANDMADSAKDMANDAVDAAGDAANDVMDGANDAVDAAGDMMSNAASAVTDLISKLGDNAMMLDTDNSSLTWKGTKVTGEHSGTINFSEGGLAMDDNGNISGAFTVDMGSIANEDAGDMAEKLIGHLSSPDFFDVANHPNATLVIKEGSMKDGAISAMGDLTIKENSHPVEVSGTYSETENGVSADVNLEFDRSNYDVRYGSGKFFENLGDNLIHDNVAITGALSFSK